ncbi:MAG: thermonuclease family protein [Deltaproteobacteria bacterium]|nr:MAG: thermonuclease family protein [Deltaproteobacteria bacterium]
MHITDGDTLYVVMKPGGWASRIRLKGVNAPECYKVDQTGSPFQKCSKDKDFYGFKSYEYIKNLLSGNARRVKLSCVMDGEECEKDEFGRHLAYLETPDGKDVGTQVLLDGNAWAFTRYTNEKVAVYCQAEADAIRNKKGMWGEGRPAVKKTMSTSVYNWYYKYNPNHDKICSTAMKTSFAKAAGE